MLIIKKHSLKLKCQEIEKKNVKYKTINWSAIKKKKNPKCSDYYYYYYYAKFKW